MQLNVGELGSAVDGDEKIQPALLGADFGDVDMEVADRVRLELLAGGPIALYIRKPVDAMPLKTAMQRGAGQLRDGGLERVEAVIQRQQRVLAKGDDDGFLFQRKHRGMRRFRTRWKIGYGTTLPPLGHCLGVDAVAPRQRSQALLTMLYRSTHCRCRAALP